MSPITHIGPACMHCNRSSELTTGKEIYPHRADLYDRSIWICRPCHAYVGCHKDGRPLGRPANAQLRAARIRVHDVLDPIWHRSNRSKYRKGRLWCYRMLSDRLGIPIAETHTALFDLETCTRAVAILTGKTFEDVLRHRDAHIAGKGTS